MEDHRMSMEVRRAAEQPAQNFWRMQTGREWNQVRSEAVNEEDTVVRRAMNTERMQEVREIEGILPLTCTEQAREADREPVERVRRIFDGFSPSEGTVRGYLDLRLMSVECQKSQALYFIHDRNVGSFVSIQSSPTSSQVGKSPLLSFKSRLLF